jgi:tagaturonate reductase
VRFIFSNTTEAGIVFDPADRLEERPARSFPAKLTQFLYHRYRQFGGDPAKGCIIFPCELIEQNGDRLREIMVAYAELWQLEPGYKEWLTAANAFCNTLVDRIVPGFPRQQAEAIWQALGYRDELLVQGETYHQWIIAGPDWVAAEFPVGQTDLNVHFVPDVTPYRNLKVRILNGAHTAMTPIGHLAGLESVLQVMEDEALSDFVTNLLWQEILPTLDFPPAEREAYAEAVLDRFRNPYLRHRLLDIALNSSAKFPARLLPSLLAYRDRYQELPERIVFALAALLHLYRFDPLPMRDDPEVVGWLQGCWRENPAGPVLAQQILARADIWGQDLTAVPGFVERLGYHLQQIEQAGVRHALPG